MRGMGSEQDMFDPLTKDTFILKYQFRKKRESSFTV